LSNRPTLVVPVRLDALVVNEALRQRDGFRSWRQNYLALDDFASPEPEEGDRQSDDPLFTSTGVHLHWTLPRGLRHGVEDPATGHVRYPLVPNRWLVTRFSGTGTRRARAWVVESDCPHTPHAHQAGHPVEHSSPYLASAATLRAWRASTDPYRNARTSEAPQAHIGLAFPLTDAEPWTERAARDPLFLTAMDNGDPYFTAYVPHNTNVFSFLDDLSDIGSAETLGYQVIGWYSDPDADILATLPDGTSYPDLLAHLGWQDPRLGDPAVPPATRSLYSGLALTILWDPDPGADPPSPDPLHTVQVDNALNVAVGNTTEDAFTALAGHALHAAGATPSTSDIQLLRAFLHDLLDVADEKGGDERVRRKVHAASFGATTGGYHWTVTPPPTDQDGAGTPPEPFTPPEWLATLNDDQRELDEQLGELYELQWRLNAMWFKNGLLPKVFPPPDGAPDQEPIQAELDPDREGSLAHTVRTATARVRAQAAKVPQPDPAARHADAHEALQAGIAAFAAAKGLPAGATLKAVPRASFWRTGNPVVSLSGIQPPADTTVSDDAVPARPLIDGASTLVRAVTVGGRALTAAPGQGPMPGLPGLGGLPPEVPALLAECFLLDPGNAPALATAAGLSAQDVAATITARRPADWTGTLPALGLDPWTQPWEPLFMEWKTSYLHIPHSADGRRCWTFDGTDYRYTPGAAIDTDHPVEVKGISALGPHPRSLFAARLKEFVARHGSAGQRDQVDAWLAAIGDWGFLAQELTGFNERLAARDTRAFRRPTPDDPQYPQTAGLAGYTDAATADGLPARYRGRVTTAPYLPDGESATFNETRQGQVHLEELFLYDKFGRVLDVVSPDLQYGGLHDYRGFPLVIDDALATGDSLTPDIAAVAQLPPRPLQPARLDFDLLDGRAGTRVVRTAADPSPVAGWILPNHLDRSLLLYEPAGRLLGTYRLLTGTDGRRTGRWEPPPDGDITTLDDVAALAPVLAGLLRSRRLATEPNLTAFLDVIDSTLWTADPLGRRADQNLSVLIGRPLALVPAQLRLVLDGPPLRDTGWAATLDPPPPEFTAHEFSVRLGDQAARDDGLVGFYRAAPGGGWDHEHFDSVTPPGGGQDYITRIGPPGPEVPPGEANWLHLTFGDTAPTKVLLLLDPRAGTHATCGITPTAEVAVPPPHVDGALRRIEALFRFGPVLTGEQDGTVTLPHPAARQGTWSWLRPAPGDGPWTPYELAQALPNAQFQNGTHTVEDGLLRFLFRTEPEQQQ
jgi:hypothetical protein